jgi:hypothetical protein
MNDTLPVCTVQLNVTEAADTCEIIELKKFLDARNAAAPTFDRDAIWGHVWLLHDLARH